MSPTTLVGRDQELDQITTLLEDDQAVLLVGQGGVGKTALIKAAAQLSGRRSFSGGGLEVLRERSYLAVGRAIDSWDLTGDPSAVAAVIESTIGPDLLVVDDAHLADDGSLSVLEALVGRVAVMVSARPGRNHGASAPERLADAGFVVLDIPPLDDRAARRLAARVNPAFGGDALRQMLLRAGGVPLLIEEFGRGGLNDSLARALVPRLEELTAPARAAALRLSLDDGAQEVNDPAVATALLDGGFAVPDGDGLRIRHGLIADAVVAASSPDEQREAHRDLARERSHPGEVAAHLFAAGAWDQARAAALVAAEQTTALDARASHLLVAARASDPEQRVQLPIEAAEVLIAAYRPDRIERVLDELETLQSDLSDETKARASRARAIASLGSGEFHQAAEQARAGLNLVGDRGDDLECSLLLASVRAEFFSGRAEPTTLRVMLDRALRLGETGRHQAAGLETLALIQTTEDMHQAVETWRAAVVLAAEEGDVISEMRGAYNALCAMEFLSDPLVNLDFARSMVARAEAMGLGGWRTDFQMHCAIALHHSGRFRDAMHELDAVDLVAVNRDTRRNSQVLRSTILAGLGLIDEADRHIRVALAEMSTAELDAADPALSSPGVLHTCGIIALAGGRPHDAISIVEPVLQQGPLTGIATILGAVDAWARHDLGLPVTTLAADSEVAFTQAMADEVRGVRLLAEDPHQAAEVLEEAARNLRRQDVSHAMRARWGAAEARRLAGAPDAVQALLAVEAEAQQAGLVPIVVRAQRSLRLTGMARSAPRALDRSGLVTGREREVLDLVAKGLSNAEIGRRLGVGRPTVRRLLENARGKLGATDRITAAARLLGRSNG